MLPNDNVSMSVGHLDHVLIIYSSMEHVTWKSEVSTLSLSCTLFDVGKTQQTSVMKVKLVKVKILTYLLTYLFTY